MKIINSLKIEFILVKDFKNVHFVISMHFIYFILFLNGAFREKRGPF